MSYYYNTTMTITIKQYIQYTINLAIKEGPVLVLHPIQLLRSINNTEEDKEERVRNTFPNIDMTSWKEQLHEAVDYFDDEKLEEFDNHFIKPKECRFPDCHQDIGKYGHNPEPLLEGGRCCDKCNTEKVIPFRLGVNYLRYRN